MKYLFVLSESRKPKLSAVIERGTNSEWQRVYRVTIAKRFLSLDDAISYYLKAAGIPKKQQSAVETEIRHNAKKRVRESPDSI